MAGSLISMQVDASSLNDLINSIRDLDRKAVRPGIKDGLSKVMQQAVKEARKRLKAGLVRRSIGWKVVAMRSGAGYVGIVKPRKGFETTVRAPFLKAGKKLDPRKIAHFIEYGRSIVRIKKKRVLSSGEVIYGTEVKAVAPKAFMRPAAGAIEPFIHRIMSESLDRALQKAWGKARARYG